MVVDRRNQVRLIRLASILTIVAIDSVSSGQPLAVGHSTPSFLGHYLGILVVLKPFHQGSGEPARQRLAEPHGWEPSSLRFGKQPPRFSRQAHHKQSYRV